jgi:hypothetical protein
MVIEQLEQIEERQNPFWTRLRPFHRHVPLRHDFILADRTQGTESPMTSARYAKGLIPRASHVETSVYISRAQDHPKRRLDELLRDPWASTAGVK